MPEQSLTITDDRTGKSYTVPIESGTVRAMDLRQIKTDADDFGLMTYDPALMNTASTKSAITFIDGDKGILEYRGYPVEQLAERCNFLEVAYLILFGELPNRNSWRRWTYDITHHTFVHENIKTLMQAFRYDAHPMECSSALSLHFQRFIPTRTRSVTPTIGWRKSNDSSRRCDNRRVHLSPQSRLALYLSDNDLSYTGNFLNMMFKMTDTKVRAEPGTRTRARRALHFARGPRTELQHQCDARDRFKLRGSLQRDGWRGSGALWSATRRRVWRLRESILSTSSSRRRVADHRAPLPRQPSRCRDPRS